MDERILVVDDEKPICDMLDLALTRAGYSVVIAESAEAAVTAMETEKCPVMFIDFSLPGMNGLDLYNTLKCEHPSSVAYLMTGYVSESARLACDAAGFQECLIKPVDLQTLVKAAHAAFEQIRTAKTSAMFCSD
jgi:two-component system response regulator GlrR